MHYVPNVQKAHMKRQPIALLCKQTHQVTSAPNLCHSSIYRNFLYNLFLIEDINLNIILQMMPLV